MVQQLGRTAIELTVIITLTPQGVEFSNSGVKASITGQSVNASVDPTWLNICLLHLFYYFKRGLWSVTKSAAKIIAFFGACGYTIATLACSELLCFVTHEEKSSQFVPCAGKLRAFCG